MTSPVDRITEVLREHVWDENQARCSCGEQDEPNTRQWDYTEGQWAIHAAAAVLAALQLTEEWKVLFPMHGDYLHSGPTPFPPRHATNDGEEVQCRWVSPWVGLP